MSTIINQFEINGIVDTNQQILSNINLIAEAAGCFVTFDPAEGKWSVVINEAGTSARSFDDSTIVGAINVSGSGIDELFNNVEVIFPHADLKDDEDSVRVSIVGANRYPNELDNTLTIRQPLINNPIQAEYLANRELKQSRQDKVIQFKSDYSALELKAGDIIDITSTIHGYSNKLFRIITLVEIDTDDGGIECEITAIEYDDAVYDTTGLEREERTKRTGIGAGEACPAIQTKENEGVANSLENEDVKDKLTNELFAFQTDNLRVLSVGPGFVDYDYSDPATGGFLNYQEGSKLPLGYSFEIPYTGKYMISAFLDWGVSSGVDGGGFFTIEDSIRKRIRINNKYDGVEIPSGNTSIFKGEDPWADQNMYQVIDLTAGTNIDFQMQAQCTTDETIGSNHSVIRFTLRVAYLGGAEIWQGI